MKIPITSKIIKREINPRSGLDSDYIDELKNTTHWPALIVNKEMILIDGFHRHEAAYHTAQKMAEQDRKLSPSSMLIIKAVRKIQETLPQPPPNLGAVCRL